MPKIDWSEEKNQTLIKSRGVSFEDVLECILEGLIISDFPHPNQTKYPKQKVLVVIIKKYTYAVPYVTNKKGIFLKTIYPSRKYYKSYLKTKKWKEVKTPKSLIRLLV